ncbi:MAG: hypothetical protein V8Q42_08515 [Anaerovoracaceae bacterium]
MMNPMPKGLIKDFASKVDKLYVIEEGDPFFEDRSELWEQKSQAARICSRYRANTTPI